MGSEGGIEKSRSIRDRLNWKHFAAVGASAVALTAGIFYEGYDKSGEITSYEPIKKGPEMIDNRLKILNWNMHNETSAKFEKIEEIIERHQVDAVALQEISAKDAKGLHNFFPNAYIKFVMADAKTKFLEGGYGNALMTFQEQKDVTAIKISGNSAPDALAEVTAGFVADASQFNISLERTKAGTQEDRSAIASTIEVQKGEELVDVRLMTGHIGAPQDELHQQQFSKIREFVKENSEDKSSIFCGDLNLGPDEVLPSFLRLGFYAHQTKSTTLSGATTDYCAYHPGEVFGEGEVIVLGNRTDHYALLGKWKTTP